MVYETKVPFMFTLQSSLNACMEHLKNGTSYEQTSKISHLRSVWVIPHCSPANNLSFSQILRVDHHILTSLVIRSQIEALETETISLQYDDPQDGPHEHDASNDKISNVLEKKVNITSFGNISIGSPEKPCTFQELEREHQDDPAFERFRIRFGEFLDILLREQDSPVKISHNQPLSIKANELVSDMAFIQIPF